MPKPRDHPEGTRPARLVVVTGGARSGKSRYAEALAKALGGDDVTVVATLEAGDEELARRVARHRQRRPPAWHTVESPRHVAAALARASTAVVLLDCLSGWISNLLLEHQERGEEAAGEAIFEATGALLEAIGNARKTVVVVTNEVGAGVVPATPLGRWYRDALGLANQRVAAAADAVVLMTIGIPQRLKGALPEVAVAP